MALRSADPRKPRHGGVTMADIGRLAGVTQVTVSRALSAPEKVSAETLQRVRNAISQTGYVPNALAGALASSKSNLISALVPSITNVVYSSMLHAFSEIMRGHGYQILVSETGADAEREEQAIAAHLSRRPDAVLLTGVKHGPAVRRMLVNAAVPVVEIWDLTDTPIDCCVGFSHAETGHAAADFAIDAGYRHAATITAGDERARRRRDAFAARFGKHSGSVPLAVNFDHSASLGAGRQALAQLLEQGVGKGVVTFCSSDQSAQGVLVEAQARGLSVPRDIAVIGFGDQEFAASTEPALTSIRIDRHVLGSVAANALVDRFAGAEAPESVHDIGFELIRRGSA